MFIEQVETIAPSSLPSGVGTYVHQHYKDKKITPAGKVTVAQGKTFYAVEVSHKGLVFDDG